MTLYTTGAVSTAPSLFQKHVTLIPPDDVPAPSLAGGIPFVTCRKTLMWHAAGLVALVLYLTCSLWFLVSSLMQIHLLWKSKSRRPRTKAAIGDEGLPMVTIQVPVFNERYVIARLLRTLSDLDYPSHLLEVQVLDDSTDDTTAIIGEHCHWLQHKGISVEVIHRTDRQGYKAGALQAALPNCRGSLIAIFDADFTPAPDFLRRMVHYFEDPRVGGVQGRWGHRNLRDNWLTVIQSYLLDSHFTLEQKGRSSAGYFVNFNGTAGMWRKQCIIESGGWNGNVLTEDLELSYRAQLNGWKFIYDESVSVPADLPVDMLSFKKQQFRWAKGMTQSSLCHLKKVFSLPIRFSKKMHAAFHLLGSVSFLAVLGNILLTLPILAARHYSTDLQYHSQFVFYTGISLPVICLYYATGTRANLTRKEFWTHLPLFLVVYMSLSAQNSVAVIQAWMGYRTPFVRTPKPDKAGTIYNDPLRGWSVTTIFESFVLCYIIVTIVASIVWHDYLFLSFLFMPLAGFIILLIPEFRSTFRRQRNAAGIAGYS